MQDNLETLDPEMEILQSIFVQADHVRQRDLARIAGLSLGMTNSVVKRLVQKGWLTIRKVNNRNIHYVVSAAGIDQITRRSYRYLKRTIKNIVYYRETIEKFVLSLSSSGCTDLVLVGRSDLEFIVERACQLAGVHYICDEKGSPEIANSKIAMHPFLLYAETYLPDAQYIKGTPHMAFLIDVINDSKNDKKSAD